jgi:hypothetical protein
MEKHFEVPYLTPRVAQSIYYTLKVRFGGGCRCNGREATDRLSNPQAGSLCSPEFAAETPNALTHSLPLVSASRLAHLCRSRPRGSVREQAACSPANLRPTRPPLQFGALKRFFPFIILVLVVLVVVLAVHIDWTWKRKLWPRGGRYFFHRVELAVPVFRQSDEKWRDDALGGVEANGTLGGEGCAVAAAAMVFRFYGIETDPQQLNWFLTSVDGYTENGWIYWDRAAWFAPDRVRHVYEDLASYQLIDSNLARGNPVIVRVRVSGGVTHFVVIAGKDGFDYLVRDPGWGAAKGLYPLWELGSKIEGLRFYEPIANGRAQLSAKR